MNSAGLGRGKFSLLNFLFLLAVCFFAAVVIAPNFIRARAQGRMSGGGCKSNLKNIGTAMEMYSTDNEGHYPDHLTALTPKYLRELPECTSTGKMTFTLKTGPKAPRNSEGYADYFFLQCEGDNHSNIGLPPNYPQYDAINGLFER